MEQAVLNIENTDLKNNAYDHNWTLGIANYINQVYLYIIFLVILLIA